MDSEKKKEQQQNQHLQYSKNEKQLLLYIVYDIPLSESTEKLGFEDDIHIVKLHFCRQLASAAFKINQNLLKWQKRSPSSL